MTFHVHGHKAVSEDPWDPNFVIKVRKCHPCADVLMTPIFLCPMRKKIFDPDFDVSAVFSLELYSLCPKI